MLRAEQPTIDPLEPSNCYGSLASAAETGQLLREPVNRYRRWLAECCFSQRCTTAEIFS